MSSHRRDRKRKRIRLEREKSLAYRGRQARRRWHAKHIQRKQAKEAPDG